MQSFGRIAAVLYLLGLSGCTYSIHPLLEKEHLSRKYDLSGVWQGEEIDPTTNVKRQLGRIVLKKRDRGSTYLVTFEPESHTAAPKGTWQIQVGQCGNRNYLQCRLTESTARKDGECRSPLSGIPVYLFSRFELSGDELQVYYLNDAWVDQSLDSKTVPQIRKATGWFTREIILTAGTDQLRELVEKHDESMFLKEAAVFRRIAEASPKKAGAAK